MIADVPFESWRPMIPGWSEDILGYYEYVAEQLPAEARIVEVGVCYGRSAVFMAEQLVKLGKVGVQVWCVDWWKDADFDQQIQRTLTTYATAQERQLLKIVRADGVRAASLFDDYELDFVFIDSDHEYEGMKRHLDAWLPKVRSGGTIAGHDYSFADWPGVVRAVDECFGASKVGRPTRTVWSYRVPKHGDHG